MNPKLATFLKAVVPILVALASIFVIAGYAASPEFHAATIASLDEKTGTVLELTAASTAASAAITLLPGDTATPIADKLAELSSYFLIVISAIYLEKYLTTITGYAAFVILIPAACLLLSVNAFARRHQLRRIAWKLIVFALAEVFQLTQEILIHAVSNVQPQTVDPELFHPHGNSVENVLFHIGVTQIQLDKIVVAFPSFIPERIAPRTAAAEIEVLKP